MHNNNNNNNIEYSKVLSIDSSNIDSSSSSIESDRTVMHDLVLSQPLLIESTSTSSSNNMPSVERIPEGNNDATDKAMKQLSSIITAVGNFSVQYNFQAIGIALYVMSLAQCTLDDDIQCAGGHQKNWVSGNSRAGENLNIYQSINANTNTNTNTCSDICWCYFGTVKYGICW